MENKRWSQSQVQELMERYHNTPIEELMKVFNKTKMAIRWKASQVGLTQARPAPAPYHIADLELLKIEKHIYNSELRHGTVPPYIYVSIGGQMRFSAAFVLKFDIKGSEEFNFFTDKSFGKRFFFKFETGGDFTVQVHDRRSQRKSKKNIEYLSQSVGIRLAIIKAYPEFSNTSIKLVLSDYHRSQDAYEFIPMKVAPRGRKKKAS